MKKKCYLVGSFKFLITDWIPDQPPPIIIGEAVGNDKSGKDDKIYKKLKEPTNRAGFKPFKISLDILNLQTQTLNIELLKYLYIFVLKNSSLFKEEKSKINS